MTKFVSLLLLLCLYSCQNSEPIWLGYLIKSQSPGFNSLELANKSETDLDQFLYANFIAEPNIEKISNLQLRNYISAKKLIAEERYTKAKTLLKSTITPVSFSQINKIIFENEINLLLINIALETAQFQNASKLLTKHNNARTNNFLIDQHFSIKYLIAEAKLKYESSEPKLAMAAIHYALHLQVTHFPSFLLLHQELLVIKATYLINEGEEGRSIANGLFKKIMKDSTSINLYNVSLTNLISINSNKNKKEAKALLDQGFKGINNMNQSEQNYFLITYLYYYMVNGSHKDKSDALKVLDLYRSDLKEPCIKNKYVFDLFKVDILKTIERFEEAEDLLNVIKVHEICEEHLKKLITYYINSTKASAQNSNIKIDSTISFLNENRKLSKELFSDLHFSDAYVQITDQIYEILHSRFGKTIPLKYHSLIINLYQDTKNRELSITNIQDLTDFAEENTALSKINFEINEGLRISNDFKETSSFTDPIYKNLYDNYKIRDSTIQVIYQSIADPDPPIIKTELLKKHLLQDTTTLVLALKIHDYYHIISYDGENLKLNKFQEDYITSLNEKVTLNKNLKFSKTKKTEYEKFMDKISPGNNKLIVIPDGIINLFPFDLDHHQYYIETNINKIYDRRKIYLQKGEVGLLAFSDSTTRKTTKPQEVGELYNDFEECQAIKNIIGKDTKFKSGKNCTMEVFTKFLSYDALHLVTHAYGNTDNRFSSYLYLRDSIGSPVKVYLNELYKIKKSPQFICLSACDTGKGTQISGQGNYSLSKPFLMRGTETVLKSYWNIDDQATKLFMREFYKNWTNGIPINQALNMTKGNFKESNEYSNPFFWAGFILEGNPNLYLK